VATARKLAVLLHHLWVSGEALRTIAQQQPNDSGDSRIERKTKTKQKPFQEEKRHKPKAEFR
jgi:hypothetical protein